MKKWKRKRDLHVDVQKLYVVGDVGGQEGGANFQLHFQLSAKISFGQRLFFAAGYVVSSFYHITTILFIIGIVNVIFARLFLIF